jgi:RNA recognition motif. (a.k.a. RRM, RBD, or RNP domain)
MYLDVGNIDHSFTKESPRSLFEPFGPVSHAVARRRDGGLAFVVLEMPKDDEGNAAINALPGSLMATNNFWTMNAAFTRG